MDEKYMTIKETANAWGMSERWVRKLCATRKIPGAVQFGRAWAIPSDAKKPADSRVTSGKYVGWRKKIEE